MYRKKLMMFICNSIFMLSFSCIVIAQAPLVEVENGYVRGLPPSVLNTSAYMDIINSSDEMVMLMGARSSAAKSVSLHQTTNTEGMMNMAHMDMIHIPAKSKVSLESGGIHIMLVGLKTPLQVDEMVEIVLLFNDGVEHVVSLPVRSVLDE